MAAQLELPASINDITVSAIGENCFTGDYSNETLESVIIPSNIKLIGPGAFFRCSALKEAILSEGIETIDYEAFLDCTSLEEVILPDSICHLEAEAFESCESLHTVILPSHLDMIKYYTFYLCHSLEEIQIPDTVREIEFSAFEASGISSVYLPEGVETIGELAFSSNALQSVSIPSTVTDIDSAFLQASSLKEIIVSPDNPNYCSVDGVLFDREKTSLIQYPAAKPFFTEYTVPEGVKTIERRAFQDAVSLEQVYLPDSLTTMEPNVFFNCTGLTSITIPASLSIREEDEEMPSFCFYKCTSLETVIFEPDSHVTLLPNYFFANCSSLRQVNLPAGLTAIKDYAFECTSGNSVLERISLPVSLQSIGESAFNKCTALSQITYAGTGEQFQGISLGRNWNQNTLISQITCSDGIISLEE